MVLDGMSVDDLVGRLEHVAAGSADHHEFRKAADPLVRDAIGYDVAAWVSVDPATHLFTSCDVFLPWGPAEPQLEQEGALFASEFADEDPLTFTKLISGGRVVSRLRAEVADPTSVERYRTLMQPAGAEDEMRAVFRDDWGVWGGLILYRTNNHPLFEESDEKIIAACAPVVAGAYRMMFLQATTTTDVDDLDRPPGSLTADTNGRIVTTSEPAERWLDTLTERETRGALARVCRRASAGRLGQVNVVGTEGPVSFHAHSRKGAEGEVSVIVEQPRPSELAEVIMAANALSPREAAVTRLVCQGLTTRQMADALEISEYTVQDHLKSVFAKFHVSTRGELLHSIYGRFYQPRRDEGATPGPYGFFLGG